MVSRHNRIRDILVETCHRAHIGVKVEVSNNLVLDFPTGSWVQQQH